MLIEGEAAIAGLYLLWLLDKNGADNVRVAVPSTARMNSIAKSLETTCFECGQYTGGWVRCSYRHVLLVYAGVYPLPWTITVYEINGLRWLLWTTSVLSVHVKSDLQLWVTVFGGRGITSVCC